MTTMTEDPQIIREWTPAEQAAVAVGMAAAGGDAQARRRLRHGDGCPHLDERGVPQYITQKAFADLLGTVPSHLRMLAAADRMVEPDVLGEGGVRNVPGWSLARAIMFGIETGYLLADGCRNPVRAGRPKFTRAPAHWRRQVVVYLTATKAADFLGVCDEAVYQARDRDRFPEPSVMIGSLNYWTPKAIKEHNDDRAPHRRAASEDPGPQPG